jgi:hypothetical protein
LLATQLQIPVILPEWIHSCWAKQSLLPHKDWILPPFAGCVISVTGLTATTRNEIQRLAKAYGGEYTPNLTKRCTHLLSKVPQGIKYRYALEWGIHCVSIHWFFDSINLQVCADETRYFLPMSEATRQALFNPLATSARDLNRLSPALRKKHLMQLHRKRRTPTSAHPYDLYIISAPFSRVSNSTGNQSSRTLIRSVRSDNPLNTSPTPHTPPFMFTSDTNSEMKPDKEEEEEDEYGFSKPKSEEMDDLETETDTTSMLDIMNNQATISELHKLLSLCDQTINEVTLLASQHDLSPYLDTLTNVFPTNITSPEPASTPTTPHSETPFLDK